MDENTFIINRHLSMTVPHPASHPLPTSKQIICPFDFGPKAFFWRESFRVASRHRLNLPRSDMSRRPQTGFTLLWSPPILLHQRSRKMSVIGGGKNGRARSRL